MKFCQPHWDRLKDAIESRGLGHLIAANGRDAHARAVAELKGENDLSDYDPLMSAHWQIVREVQDWLAYSGGNPLSLYFGDVCPICEALKTYPPIPAGHRYASNESYFIDGPADAALAFCQQSGIDKPVAAPDPEGER